jgi:hypothetical protein
MKIWELHDGVRTILSNEEFDLVEKMMENADCVFSERDEVVAQRLVSKSVLIRTESEHGHDDFKLNYRLDTWRD